MQMTLPHPLLSQLSDLVTRQMGLHYPAKRWGDLERGINAAVPALGMKNAEACVRHILSASLTRDQIQVLARYLTIGETYFFREKKVLHILEESILPELIRSCARNHRMLRIWSAGCCTGEEPYSIAMILDRLIHPSAEWNATILATDINPAFLQKAVDGIYNDQSFRDTPGWSGWMKERYFKKRKNGQFEILPHIRKRVTFSYLNLAEDTYPSSASGTDAMDVIFCRNVLMYFSPEGRRKIAQNFHRSLVDSGWLIVSPVEVSSNAFSQFRTRIFPEATLYQKSEIVMPRAHAPHCSTPTPVALSPLPDTSGSSAADLMQASRLPKAEFLEATKKGSPAPASSPRSEKKTPHSQTRPLNREESEPHYPHSPRDRARSHANLGQISDAIKQCEKAIAADKLNGANHYLMAILQRESGQDENAAQSLARTLYLDPDFVLAHFALANLHLSQGRKQDAARHFDNTLSLLHKLPPDALLPESEGLVASRLIEIIHYLGYSAALSPSEHSDIRDARDARRRKLNE